MKALLLSAGMGTRLAPLSNTIPKPLMPVVNMPLIEYGIRNLLSAGIRDFTINVFHLAKELTAGIKKLDIKDAQISFSEERELWGTGGGIKRMLEEAFAETIVVSNTDIISNFDIKKLVKLHKESGNPITLVLIPRCQHTGYSTVVANDEGLVEDFIHKLPREKALREKIPGIFTGIHIYSRKSLFDFPPKEKFCVVNGYYRKILRDGGRIGAIFAKGDFLDTGDLKKYLDANIAALSSPEKFVPLNEMLNNRYTEPEKNIFIHKSARLSKNTSLIPPLIIGENSLVKGGTSLGPHAIIGKSCHIRDRSRISESVILENSQLPSGSILKREIFWEKSSVKIDSGTVV